VQIKALGLKLALQRWGVGGLYTGERPQGHHGPLVILSCVQNLLGEHHPVQPILVYCFIYLFYFAVVDTKI
jgi:hypothetical protein